MTTSIGTENTKQAELVEAAFQEIAQKGFAGLRTRAVAAKVGITQATLHYYFPSKQTLIAALVDYAVAQIDTVRTIQAGDRAQNPAEELRQHFAAILQQIERDPTVFRVLDEIALYAQRDVAIAGLMATSDQGWTDYLVDLLQRGIDQGLFQPMLDVTGCAELIAGFFKGAVLQAEVTPAAIGKAVRQLETLIIQNG